MGKNSTLYLAGPRSQEYIKKAAETNKNIVSLVPKGGIDVPALLASGGKAVQTPELDKAVGNTGSKKSNIWGDFIAATKEAAKDGAISPVYYAPTQSDYNRLDRLSNKEYKDTFGGQFGANRTASRLSQDASLAWNTYLQNPNETTRKYAEAASKAAEQFQLKNTEVLDDVNAKAPFLTKDLAGYLPQLGRQTAAQVGGGLLGAAAGPAGIKAGAVLASGAASADVMRGAAFKTLVDLGIDEETAIRAASDEAFISGLAESADTLVNLATLGTGKLISLLGKGAAKTAGKEASKSVLKKVLGGLGKYGLNIGEEALGEGFQSAVSIANIDRLEEGKADSGKLDLAKRALSLYWDRFKGEASEEDAAEIKASEAAGARLAALLGGVTMAGTAVANRGVQQSNPLADTILAMEAERAQQSNPLVDTLTGEDSTIVNTAVAQNKPEAMRSTDATAPAFTAEPEIATTSVADTLPQNGPVVNEQGPDMPGGPFHPINEQGAANAQQFYGRGPTYVPKENFEGHLTSKLASTLVNSGVTNNGVAQSLMDAIGRGELSHLKFTDEAAMRYAQDTIMRKGYASALEQFKAEISSGQRGKKLMALGIELLNNASTNGDNVTAADIATYLVDAATEQAQAIQVLHVLNKATPEGRLYFAVKGLDNLLARMEAKYGDRAANIEVNQDLINSYYEAVKGGDEDAITDAWGQVISDVAQQVPPNWVDKLNAWRYLSMLGNPKTHIRNIVGNAAFMPVRMMKDIVGAGLEAMTGTKNRTKAVLNRSSANDKALLQMSWGDYTKMMDTIQSGGKYNDDYGSIENERTIFGLKPLEAARKKSSEYLDKEDTWFSQRAYAHALAGWMKANGITPQQFAEMLNDTTSGAKPTVTHDLKVGDTVRASDRDNFGKIVGVNDDGSYSVHFKNDAGHEATVKLDGSILTPTGKKNTSTNFDVKTATTSEILSEARAYAVKEAQKATYRDTNAFSEWVSKIGKVNANSSGVQKVVGTLAEGVLPFRKTPANIVVRGMEYSPIGLAYGIGEAVYGVKNGTVSAAQAIDHIASGITGTAILGLGALLAKMGVATASEDNDEKQAAFDKLRGEQAYALNVGDRSYTIDWLAPEALPFFTGIELYNWWSDAQEGGDANLQDFFDSLGALADPILETSMLSSVNDLLDSIAYARGSGFGGIGNIAKTAVMSYISQFVPTVLGQVERSFEGGRQETYTRGDSSILNASGQYDWGNLMNKNPLYDYNQVDYVDAWGRTQDYGKGNLFNQFLNPSYVSTDRSTAVDDELQRLYDAGQTAVFPQRFAQSDQVTTYDADGESTGKRYLTAEEYEQFNRTMGQTRLELAEKLIQSSAYKAMGNEAKAKAISLVYEYGKAVATKEVEASYKLDGWVQKAMDSDDPARYIQMYAATKALTPPEGSDSVKKYQELGVMAKQSRDEAEADGWIKGQFTELQGKKYDLAREYGFSPERFVEFYEAQSVCDNNKKKVIDYLINKKGWPADQANNIAKLCSLWGSKEETVNNWRW